MANSESGKRHTYLPLPPQMIPAHKIVLISDRTRILQRSQGREMEGPRSLKTSRRSDCIFLPSATSYPFPLVDERNMGSAQYEVSPCPFSQTKTTHVSLTTQTALITRSTAIKTEDIAMDPTLTTRPILIFRDMNTRASDTESNRAKRFMPMTFETSVIISTASDSHPIHSLVTQTQISCKKHAQANAMLCHPDTAAPSRYSVGAKRNQTANHIDAAGFWIYTICGGLAILLIVWCIFKCLKQILVGREDGTEDVPIS
jgi:hypothetical protein